MNRTDGKMDKLHSNTEKKSQVIATFLQKSCHQRKVFGSNLFLSTRKARLRTPSGSNSAPQNQ
jgi:hypothetical protein